MIRSRALLAGTALACLLATSGALACPAHRHGAQAPGHMRVAELKQFGTIPHATLRPEDSHAPLWPGMGSLSFAAGTAHPRAQRYVDQGLTLAFGFNHAEARRSFQAAQRLDPGCALCHWGEALVLGPNINAPMGPGANEAALAAIATARRFAARAGERERALVDALALRYSADPAADRKALDGAYADAMVAVAARFPDDAEIATLAAEALMDLSPWDYWGPGGVEPKGRTPEVLALLERVLARDPDHVGAIHLYIHAVEASSRPERAEPYADRLARQDLGAGHLVHMPSHIYYRLGRYRDSLEANKRAVAADEAFLRAAPAAGIYSGGYYPHNIHFLMVSAQMAGDGPAAIEAAGKLERSISDEVARQYPWIQPIKAAPYFAHAQFSSPERILALPRPSGGFGYVDAMWHYARGVAFATRGELEAAQAEADAIHAIAGEPAVVALAAGGLPAPDILGLAREMVLGRMARSAGWRQGAVAAFERAATIEDRLPYMEPPFWSFPVRQSLGAELLRAGDATRAEEAFRQSLKAAPSNAAALFGLAEAQAARGAFSERAKTLRRFDKAFAGERATLSLERL